ncbi:uncharacterized protein LOC119674899 [Teleopsis dalmanni]|uniref:uncharacterized protein LOC119674899 n=1 Tax=Teleopsis dalmanni TaxID=139649 RepID=UPI0018CC93C0|nr:uncharacterized protein LOC119674899 [Teleopsis dalmanni]
MEQETQISPEDFVNSTYSLDNQTEIFHNKPYIASGFILVRRFHKRKYKVENGDSNTPVIVTSATHTAPGDYSVTQMPPPGGYQTNVTVASYPPHQQMQPHMAPYPPMAAQNSAMNPPPYDVAVAGARYPKQSAYEKQAPYNPSYTAQ